MRRGFVVLVIGVFVVTLGATALAAGAWHTLSASTTGASFGGSWRWYANGESCGSGCYGGWERAGTLTDTKCGDNNNVFDEARVEAYGWSPRYYGTQCGSKYLDNVFYDPQATKVTYAAWHVCRDRGILYPDNCSSLQTFTR